MIFKRTFEEMCFTVQLSMFIFVLRSLSAPRVFYHAIFGLSRTFFNFFIFLFSRFFKLFFCIPDTTLCILSNAFHFVKNFFQLFYFFFLSCCSLVKQLRYTITFILICQLFFYFFSFSIKR